MTNKFEVGQKVKLTEVGIKLVAEAYDVDSSPYQNNEAEILMIFNSNPNDKYPYQIKFPDGNDFTVSEDEIILAYADESVPLTSLSKGYFETMGSEIGELVDRKQLAYGNSVDKTYRLMKIFLEKWENGDGTYTIPESLLKHMLLQVRLIDKQNRLFNNPDADLMDENPYGDSVGYNMLGVRMVEKE